MYPEHSVEVLIWNEQVGEWNVLTEAEDEQDACERLVAYRMQHSDATYAIEVKDRVVYGPPQT